MDAWGALLTAQQERLQAVVSFRLDPWVHGRLAFLFTCGAAIRGTAGVLSATGARLTAAIAILCAAVIPLPCGAIFMTPISSR